MGDLALPIVVAVKDEATAFWCFVVGSGIYLIPDTIAENRNVRLLRKLNCAMFRNIYTAFTVFITSLWSH